MYENIRGTALRKQRTICTSRFLRSRRGRVGSDTQPNTGSVWTLNLFLNWQTLDVDSYRLTILQKPTFCAAHVIVMFRCGMCALLCPMSVKLCPAISIHY